MGEEHQEPAVSKKMGCIIVILGLLFCAYWTKQQLQISKAETAADYQLETELGNYSRELRDMQALVPKTVDNINLARESLQTAHAKLPRYKQSLVVASAASHNEFKLAEASEHCAQLLKEMRKACMALWLAEERHAAILSGMLYSKVPVSGLNHFIPYMQEHPSRPYFEQLWGEEDWMRQLLLTITYMADDSQKINAWFKFWGIEYTVISFMNSEGKTCGVLLCGPKTRGEIAAEQKQKEFWAKIAAECKSEKARVKALQEKYRKERETKQKKENK